MIPLQKADPPGRPFALSSVRSVVASKSTDVYLELKAVLQNSVPPCSALQHSVRSIPYIRQLLAGTYTLRIIDNSVGIFLDIAPYLLLSIAINVIAMQWVRRRPIRWTARGHGMSILVGAVVGVLSPLPTYAAIPIGVSLTATGVPFSSIMAFIVASPLMNPSIFFLTATQLGMEMALARTVTALALGIAAGALTLRWFRNGVPGVKPVDAGRPELKGKTLFREIVGSAAYTLKFFSMAILLSAAVRSLIPAETIVSLFGPNAKMGTIAAIALGVPLYSCGGAAIPLVAALMEMGMGKGATLGFFIAGPATKIETIYAFRRMLGTRILLFYLILTLVGAYCFGTAYELFWH